MDKTSAEQLQPCPFCGSEFYHFVTSNSVNANVQCGGCAAEGPYIEGDSEASNRAEAIAAWNRRERAPVAEAVAQQAQPAQRRLESVIDDPTETNPDVQKKISDAFQRGFQHARHYGNWQPVQQPAFFTRTIYMRTTVHGTTCLDSLDGIAEEQKHLWKEVFTTPLVDAQANAQPVQPDHVNAAVDMVDAQQERDVLDARRYRKVRVMTPKDFFNICAVNLLDGTSFDDLVDAALAQGERTNG